MKISIENLPFLSVVKDKIKTKANFMVISSSYKINLLSSSIMSNASLTVILDVSKMFC